MPVDKSLQTGSTAMLLLKLLEDGDLYGYEMIEMLSKRSGNIFNLKAGTLYPLLHQLEQQELVTSYQRQADSARVRKYYAITPKGKKQLQEKREEWDSFTSAVNQVLNGGVFVAGV